MEVQKLKYDNYSNFVRGKVQEKIEFIPENLTKLTSIVQKKLIEYRLENSKVRFNDIYTKPFIEVLDGKIMLTLNFNARKITGRKCYKGSENRHYGKPSKPMLEKIQIAENALSENDMVEIFELMKKDLEELLPGLSYCETKRECLGYGRNDFNFDVIKSDDYKTLSDESAELRAQISELRSKKKEITKKLIAIEVEEVSKYLDKKHNFKSHDLAEIKEKLLANFDAGSRDFFF